ncbi:hypothetical protein [Iamia sp.]|uniref:hypothetical protein n=1 Tax=Iamia sp. TaxID=2722710 RepID=UPI002BB9FB78|nr:hypothetical protein [Iamia sp.]HXH59086.1 hypothetical protein [Iamia sp.]
MPTLTHVEGFEHGALLAAGGGIATTINGAIGPNIYVGAGGARTGGHGLVLAPTATAAARFVKTVGTASGAARVMRFYFRVDTAPTTGSLRVGGIQTVTNLLGVRVHATSTGTLEFRAGTVLVGSLGSYVVGTWYQVDISAVTTANPWAVKCSLDGVVKFDTTAAMAIDTISGFHFGDTSTTGPAGQFSIDDVAFSQTAADYPIGAGKVLSYSPNADGAHLNQTKFQDAAGLAVNSVTNAAFSELNDMPLSATTSRVQQVTATADIPAGAYLEVLFADTAETATANGVAGYLMYGSAATTANNGSTIIRNSGGVESSIYGTAAAPADMSDTAPFYKSGAVTAPAAGWTPTEVNALVGRVGYSSDVAPIPYWFGLLLQVDFPTAAPAGTTPVERTINPRWQVTAPVADTTDARWQARALVTDATDTRWQTSAPAAGVTDAVDLRWGTRAQVTDATILRSATRAATTDTTTLRHAVRVALSDATQIRWPVLAPATRARTLRWPVRQAAGDATVTRWAVRTVMVPRTNDLRWAARGATTDATALRFATRGAATDGTVLRFATRVGVADATDLRHATRAGVDDATSLRWAVRTGVDDTTALRHAVRQATVDAAEIAWATRTAATDSTTLRWGVAAAAGTATDSTTLRWGVAATASDLTNLRWRAAATIARPVELPWATRTEAAAASALRWAVRAGLADLIDLRWRQGGLAARAAEPRWSVGQAATGPTVDTILHASLGARARTATLGDRPARVATLTSRAATATLTAPPVRLGNLAPRTRTADLEEQP